MSLHARSVALNAGATEEEVPHVAQQMIELGEVKLHCAERLLLALRTSREA